MFALCGIVEVSVGKSVEVKEAPKIDPPYEKKALTERAKTVSDQAFKKLYTHNAAAVISDPGIPFRSCGVIGQFSFC